MSAQKLIADWESIHGISMPDEMVARIIADFTPGYHIEHDNHLSGYDRAERLYSYHKDQLLPARGRQ